MEILCRTKNVNKYYRVIAEVGAGTYGKVYKAECLKTNDFVALKKIDTSDAKIGQEGFPITAIREIKLLKMMNHKNVIRLREILVSKASYRNNYRGSTFLVFDYMDHDFAGLHRNKNTFNIPQLKCIFRQILEGVRYLHENKIIHRDLKSANLLLNNKGEVKLADFGLARTLSNMPNARYTYKVVTLWYRAPELLLGQQNYNTQIDMWSLGCIFAELLTGEVLFKGDIEYRQMEKIYELCGSANEYNWPNCVNLRCYEEFRPRRNYERQLQKVLRDQKPSLDQVTLDLIDQLLVLDPSKRLNAQQALNHDFFKCDPKPCGVSEMPVLEKEFHETLLKNEQKGKRAQGSNNYNSDKPFQSHAIQRLSSQKISSSQQLQQIIRDERDNKMKKQITQPQAFAQQQKQPSPQKQQHNAPVSTSMSMIARSQQGEQFNLDDILNEMMNKEDKKLNNFDGDDELPVKKKPKMN